MLFVLELLATVLLLVARTYCVGQACETLDVNTPCRYSFSVQAPTTTITIPKDSNGNGGQMKYSVNGIIPGTPIIVYEGQQVIIDVTNNLAAENVTIHWHGLHQWGTPGADGVPWVTQCPIAPGQTYTHTFYAKPLGTHWYHSHFTTQRDFGLFGVFIVKERPLVNPTNLPATRPSTDQDIIMVIGDFGGDARTAGKVFVYITDGFASTSSALVTSITNTDGTKTHTVHVEAGKDYRFRVIHAGSHQELAVSVDNHDIYAVASDGYDFVPTKVESIFLSPGERYDFILKATSTQATTGNFWIRTYIKGLSDSATKDILHYTTAATAQPTTIRSTCDVTDCLIINCPSVPVVNPRPKDVCIKFEDLEPVNSCDSPPAKDTNFKEYFLNFAMKVPPPVFYVNGIQFAPPEPLVNSLTHGYHITNNCTSLSYPGGSEKACYFELYIRDTIQFVMLNKGSYRSKAIHPIHMHGHSFYVMKVVYDDTTTKHISCGADPFCNSASWTNGQPEVSQHPIRKDTLIIPVGGYAIVRIKANNPGKWIMHCHIDEHSSEGMAIVLSEQGDQFYKRNDEPNVC